MNIKQMTNHRICLMGGPGSGKTTHLLDQYSKSLKDEKAVRWVVPTSSMAEHIKDLLLAKGLFQAVHDQTILTFDAWAQQAVGIDKTILSPLDIVPLVKQILAELKPAGFSEVLDLPQFPKSLVIAAAEMLENRVSAKKLATVANGKNQRLIALAKVVEELDRRMSRLNLILPGQGLFILAEKLNSGELEACDMLLLDGFYDFTTGQKACLDSLVKKCNTIIATLPARVVDFSRESFSSVAATRQMLLELGFSFENLESDLRGSNKGLERIFAGLFKEPENLPVPKGLSALSGETPKILIEGIANRIVKNKEANWSDTGIICRNLSPYVETIREVFSQYKIPVVIHGSAPLKSIGPTATIVNFLEVIGQIEPGSRAEKAQSVRQLLSLSTVLCSPKITHHLQFLQAYKKDENGSFIRRKYPVESLDELLEAATMPDAVAHLEFLKQTRHLATTELGNSNFIAIAKSVLRAFAQNTFYSKRFDAAGCKQGAGAVRYLIRTLDRLERNTRIFHSYSAEWVDCFAQFKELLDATSVPMSERTLDAVHVVDAMEARNWEWKTVYLIGLVNGEFPKAVPEDIYCKDVERTAISALLPTSSKGRKEEELLFCFATSRATNELVCAYHETGSDNREAGAGIFIEELRSLFQEEILHREVLLKRSRPVFPHESWTNKKQARQASIYAIGRNQFFSRRPSLQQNIGLVLFEKRLKGASLPENPISWILPQKVSILAPAFAIRIKNQIEPFSISSVETFQGCPFKFFGRFLLGLSSPPQTPVLGPAELGNIAHEVLNKYFRSGMRESLDAIFKKAEKKFLQNPELGFDEKQALNNLRNSLEILIETEKEAWLPGLGTTPFRFEFEFGTEIEPVRIEHMDRSEPFKGRIDRIDQTENGFLVIDYKLSHGAIGNKEMVKIRQGLLPQLPVYMKAAAKILDQPIIGGQIEIVRKVNRSGFFDKATLSPRALILLEEEKNKLLATSRFKELLDQALDGIFEGCERMRQGHIEIEPQDPEQTCDVNKCDFYDICRYAL